MLIAKDTGGPIPHVGELMVASFLQDHRVKSLMNWYFASYFITIFINSIHYFILKC
jgi:hypothetical protein